MSVRVKICGITNLTDALQAVEAGADALGFIFFPASPRYIAPAAAASIVSQLPPSVLKIGVFVDESVENLNRIARAAGLDRVQLHGRETMDICAQANLPVIKALRVKDESSLASLKDYDVAAFLLDSYVPGQPGGTGERFNWDLAVKAKTSDKPIFLAGGLTAENVAEAVTRVSPFGVDVSSGVETKPGHKDHAKVREFIRRAKGQA